MKRLLRFGREFVSPFTFLLMVVSFVTSCREAHSTPEKSVLSPCTLAMTSQSGDDTLARDIAHWQQQARSEKSQVRAMSLEQLGWKFIEKARASYDPGYLKLAEACAACLQSQQTHPLPEAMLLQGHALHQMHKFKEAEPVARALVKARGLSFDYGLLGDVLMEQGKLPAATEAYQEMMNQKPNLQAYSRAAHIRWLQGDLTGAAKLAGMAAGAGSPNDREATAWAYSRLAFYLWQLGQSEKATQALRIALEIQPDYAPALLIKGRLLLSETQFNSAVDVLQQAAQRNPLPDYEWTLAEALRAAGQPEHAAQVESRLMAKGAQDDPRTLALYLATRREQPDVAYRLAQAELQARADVFTYDALAWASFAAGKFTEAQTAMRQALIAGTNDPRLLYHAAVIAQQSGQPRAARHYCQQAYVNRHLLLPSEQAGLLKLMTAG